MPACPLNRLHGPAVLLRWHGPCGTAPCAPCARVTFLKSKGFTRISKFNLHLSSALPFHHALLGWGGMTADSVHGLLRALFSQHCFKAHRKLAWPRHLASPWPRPARC